MSRFLSMHFKSTNRPSFYLKALNPESLQQWVQKIQQCQSHLSNSISFPIPLSLHTESNSPFLSSLPAGVQSPTDKRDSYDNLTPASSLWPRLLNKQGKDYSKESASTIQREYIAAKSSREAMIEARRRSLSAHSLLENGEGMIN